MAEPARKDPDAFVKLLAVHELRLSAYVHALVPLWNDAEDVLQNTKMRLWEQFDQFQIGTDFAAWAFTVANFMVHTYRKQCKRQRLCFGDELLQRIAQHAGATCGQNDSRTSALVECVRRLGQASRRLLRLFYADHCRVKDIARNTGQTRAAIYQTLSRTRRSLMECVEQRLEEEKGQ